LKLLGVAAHRAATGLGGALLRDLPAAPVDTWAARPATPPVEEWLSARLQVHEKAVTEMQRSTSEAVSSLKVQMGALCTELALSRRQGPGRPESQLDEGSSAAVMARVDRGFEVLNERMSKMERAVDEMRRHASQFEHRVAADLVDIEQSIKVQSVAIESARTAMSQTDDLVERVVEALESLQTSVLDRGDDVGQPSLAVN